MSYTAACCCTDTLRQRGQDDELAWRKEGDTWDLAEDAEDGEGEEGEGDDTVTTAQLRELVEDRWVHGRVGESGQRRTVGRTGRLRDGIRHDS